MSPTPQTPPTDRPLTAGDVPLLREGDLIKGPNGKTYRFEEWGDGGFLTFIDEPFDGFLATLCTFVARPATSAASEGALAALICAILEDEGGSGAPWSVIADRIAASIIDENHLAVSSWAVRAALEKIAGEQQYRSGYCQTDITVEPALSADEAQSLARETLAALASPPVSERERELEGALREADAAIKEWFRYLHGGEMRGSYDGKPERDGLRKAGYAATRALTAQPEGEGK